METLAVVIVDPIPFFVPICQATKTVALDVDGNCEREMLYGGFLNTLFPVVSHAQNILPLRCRLQVTAHGVFTFRTFPQQNVTFT
jgi:hypothetical protein